ncbi:MAG: AraC family transcriptional regulator ligand-binding domain-containing protein [Pseudomonadota bacterium]
MTENRTVRDPLARRQWPEPGPGTLHVNFSSVVVAFALSRGMTAEQIIKITGFDIARLGDPEARIPDNVVPLLLLELTLAEPEALIPLLVAKAAPFSALGGLAHGMQHAATLRDAIEFSLLNSSVLADRLQVHIQEVGEEARVVSYHPVDALDAGCTVEMAYAIIARLMREVLGLTDALIRVDLSHAPRGDSAAYEAHFLCPVRFSAAANALIFRQGALATPVRRAEPTLFAYVEQHFEILRRQIETGKNGDRLRPLRRAITESAASGSYRAGDILHRAGLSRRGVQRLTAAHGTTLVAMIEEARQANARVFLSDPSISVEMAASLLGYSDDRAFRRAFKRWTGMSPTEFRKAQAMPGSA